MINQKIITIQGRMFQVKRKFPEHKINLNVENGVTILKQLYHCDTMFKSQGFLWLCNKVDDIDYEEI